MLRSFQARQHHEVPVDFIQTGGNTSRDFAALRLDWRANRHDTKSVIVATLYRFANLVSRQKKTRPLLYYLGAPVLIVYKMVVAWIL